jgi:hypothetical protein
VTSWRPDSSLPDNSNNGKGRNLAFIRFIFRGGIFENIIQWTSLTVFDIGKSLRAAAVGSPTAGSPTAGSKASLYSSPVVACCA